MSKIKANILVNSKKDLKKEKDIRFLPIKMFMMVYGQKTNLRAKENTFGTRKKYNDNNMMDFGKKTRCLEKGKCNGLMELLIKDCGLMIKKKLKVKWIIRIKFFVI